MTVMYCDKVASRGGFGSFFILLCRWRGSVYKMIWQDMLAFIVLYYLINFIYRFALNDEHQRTFEFFVEHCTKFRNFIPVSFVLGFFVSLVVSRWWSTYQSIPWPDTLAITLGTYVPGQTSEAKKVRATVLRYANLAIAMTFATISPAVKKNLPEWSDFVTAGHLTADEKLALENLEKKSEQHKTWIPIAWACKTLQQAREQGIIATDYYQRLCASEVMNLRGLCGGLLGYSCYNIPLVYTQVVTIAVYSFFVFTVIGEQSITPATSTSFYTFDMYVPVFAILQIFFYIGWIKVAEALLNPFGEDDHDFEFNAMLKRHREMSELLSEASDEDLPTHLQDASKAEQ